MNVLLDCRMFTGRECPEPVPIALWRRAGGIQVGRLAASKFRVALHGGVVVVAHSRRAEVSRHEVLGIFQVAASPNQGDSAGTRELEDAVLPHGLDERLDFSLLAGDLDHDLLWADV